MFVNAIMLYSCGISRDKCGSNQVRKEAYYQTDA